MNVDVSPDGRTIVFDLLGDLYTMPIEGSGTGLATRLTSGPAFDMQPRFSPDGTRIAFSPDRSGLWNIWVMNADGSKASQVSKENRWFVNSPTWAPDGLSIYARKPFVKQRSLGSGEIWQFHVSGGEGLQVTEKNGWQKDAGEPANFSREVAPDRFAVRMLRHVKVAPDGRSVVYSALGHLYVRALPVGEPRRLTADSAHEAWPAFSPDAASIVYRAVGPDSDRDVTYATEPGVFVVPTAGGSPKKVTDAGQETPAPPETAGIDIAFTQASDVPTGEIALVGARIITMAGTGRAEVIERGTLVIRGNRIVAVGPAGRVTIPSGAKRIDAAGKTIMPGIIDAHAHLGGPGDGLIPRVNWTLMANLAFGVTTSHDPSNDTETVFTMSEMVRTGELIGPRLYSTGTILYDVTTLFAKSGLGYTPTLIVSYGSQIGENYWYQKDDVFRNERLMTFVPRDVVLPRARRRTMSADDDYAHVLVSKGAKAVLDAGGKVQLGAHGQLQGLGAHWERWMLQQGGMTNLEALQAATIAGAQYLGLDKDLGSLEAGKLADLVVLDGNPLADIRQSQTVRMVMVNGRLYDAATLNQLAPVAQPRRKLYWER